MTVPGIMATTNVRIFSLLKHLRNAGRTLTTTSQTRLTPDANRPKLFTLLPLTEARVSKTARMLKERQRDCVSATVRVQMRIMHLAISWCVSYNVDAQHTHSVKCL